MKSIRFQIDCMYRRANSLTRKSQVLKIEEDIQWQELRKTL